MGAGIDAYNSYAQRGSFHVIEHQLAAAIELFPVFADARVLRTWAGHRRRLPRRLADRRADAGRRSLPQLRLGHRRLQGDAGVGVDVRAHDRARPAARAERAVRARPLHERRADRRARRRRGRALMLLHPLPVVRRARRDRVLLRRPGAGRLPRRPVGALRRGVGAVSLLPRQPEGPLHRALGAHARLPPLVRLRHGDTIASEVHLRGRRVRGPRGRDARGGARAERRPRRLPLALPRPAARRLHRRRGGAERARPDRGGADAPRDARRARGRARRRAARRQGTAASRRTPARFDTMHAHCDVLVVGAGRSGRALAAELHRAGDPGRRPRRRRRGDARTDLGGRPLRRATTCSRSSAAAGSGRSARSGSCSRPARSSGRRSSRQRPCPG